MSKEKKFNKQELQLLLDGTEDTLYRLKNDNKVKEDYDTYTKNIFTLKKKLERYLEKVKK